MSPIEQSIRAEQLRLLFKSPMSLIGAAIAVVCSVVVLWGHIDTELLLGWAGALMGWLAGRGVLWRRFQREKTDDARVVRWAWPAIVMTGVSGLLWGLFGGAFYLPSEPEISAFMILVVASMMAGGTFAYVAYLPAYDAFMASMVLPIAAASFWHATTASIVFGGMALADLALMLALGRSVSHSIVNMVRLQTANTDLVLNLRHAKEAAEIASRVKSEFLATMSHELRTPLNAVLGFSEMIRAGSSGPIDARYKGYASDIHTSGEHLLMLISDILDISKIESGRLELHEERTCLGDLTARCLRLIAPRAQEGRITIINEVPADLPHVIADEIRLKQALLNLLSNAVKFTHAEGQIEISGRRSENGGVELEVSDNGIGMRPEDIPVALEPFRQVDSKSTRPYEGTGLGLPLTKQLIELHRGSLIIKSEIDQGTSVTIRLPPERVLWADTRTSSSAAAVAAAASAAD